MATPKTPQQLKDKAWLRQEYIDKQRSTYEIADKVDCVSSTVRTWLEKHDIARRESNRQKADIDRERLHSESFLREQYHSKGKSLHEIAEICDTYPQTVRYWMDKHDIPTESIQEANSIEETEMLDDERWLRDKYHEDGLSQQEIADELGCGQNAVHKKMVEHGIERRPPCIVGYGEDNHQYKGDLPARKDYYGPNWRQQRLKARIRDQARCQRCGIAESDHFEDHERRLDVHHVRNRRHYVNDDGTLDYEQANKLSNLITLCITCHRQLEGVPIDNRH